MLFFILVLIMSGISYLLFSEYLYFRSQSEKLVTLQEDYRTYVMAVNKILRDYNKTKEKLEEISVASKGEKKKEVAQEDDAFFNVSFPERAIVFSSEGSFDYQDNFVVVNRDSEYLKNEALQFLQVQDDGKTIVKRIDVNDWGDYSEYVLSKIIEEKKERERRRKKAKKRRRVKKKPQVSSYVKFNPSTKPASNKKEKKDIVFSLPIKREKFWVSSLYGPRKKKNGSWGFHYGVDMAAWKGTPVYAAYTGLVVEARYSRGYGNNIVIAHSPKYRTRYAHLSKIGVKVGQKVKRGEQIGAVGDTGYVRSSPGRDASHLHFEVLAFGKKMNPMSFLRS